MIVKLRPYYSYSISGLRLLTIIYPLCLGIAIKDSVVVHSKIRSKKSKKYNYFFFGERKISALATSINFKASE